MKSEKNLNGVNVASIKVRAQHYRVHCRHRLHYSIVPITLSTAYLTSKKKPTSLN